MCDEASSYFAIAAVLFTLEGFRSLEISLYIIHNCIVMCSFRFILDHIQTNFKTFKFKSFSLGFTIVIPVLSRYFISNQTSINESIRTRCVDLRLQLTWHNASMSGKSNSDAAGSKGGEKRGKFRAKNSRSADENSVHPPRQKIDPNSTVLKLFDGFREELDEKHDRNERIVKLSRDVTIESKRVIFTLHRSIGMDESRKEEIFREAEEKLNVIRKEKFRQIAEEIKEVEIYQFLKSITWGYQEYIEAVSFLHYLRGGGLLTQQLAESDFIFSSENSGDLALCLPRTEFYLGIADLTGELMRLCITSTSRGDLKTPFEVAPFLRSIYTGFLLIGNQGPREMGRKCNVLKSSLEKVERACYTLRVRGSEIPSHMLADVFSEQDRDEGFEGD